jgi:hypothetical protein
LVLIPNTLELTTLWVTPPLAAEVDAHPRLDRTSAFIEMPLDEAGRLDQEALFPESVRARRGRAADARRLAPEDPPVWADRAAAGGGPLR